MLAWIIGFGVWMLGLVFVWALMSMSGDQDRAARHEELFLDPLSDVPVTQFGIGR